MASCIAMSNIPRRLVVVFIVAACGCTYDASFTDCTVACSMAAPDCPDGFSCSATEGMCRAAENVGISCAAVLDGGVDDARPDGGGTAPDANPICLVCDALSGSGCPQNQYCYAATVGGEYLFPGCSSDTPGSGIHGQPCSIGPDCADGHLCVQQICRRVCTTTSTCPTSTSCQLYAAVATTWAPCGLALCQ
jgi:hypothetical protein